MGFVLDLLCVALGLTVFNSLVGLGFSGFLVFKVGDIVLLILPLLPFELEVAFCSEGAFVTGT